VSRGTRRLAWLDPAAGRWARPPAEAALDDPPGLLAAGGALTVDWLLAAYRGGIFPWYSPGEPILWWSPDPRCVLVPAQFRRHRSLVKAARNRGYRLERDRAFAAVIDGCAAPRATQAGTWITTEMRAAYLDLHAAGYAHSVEVWAGDDLVGGLYGVRVGGVFFGESMFSRVPDASKIALLSLADGAAADGIGLIDCQFPTGHLASLGAVTVPRPEFLARVRELTAAAG
jgi:leucyl/phenylalanyl-tRNA---protein transferase